MEMSADVRKQLMEMAGINDIQEFNNLVQQMGPQLIQPHKPAGGETSPFHVHFVKLVSMVEAEGIQNFFNLNRDIEKEIPYIFRIVNTEYWDLRRTLPKETESAETLIEGTENSKTFRDRGNKAYARKELDKALNYYCAAIVSGPLDKEGKGRDVSLSLGNRSAVFFEMERWKQCLADIEAAFMYGYPPDLSYKLFERKAKCLKEFYGYPTASCLETLKLALESGQASNLKDVKKEEFCTSIQSLLDEWTIKVKETKKKPVPEFDPADDEPQCPFTIWERHPTFPPLSDSLDIAYNDEAGRHIIARKHIKAGEAIVIEEPIAAHLSRSFVDTNCTHCLKKCGRTILPSPLVPKKCKFCSLHCLKIAMNTYHKTESRISLIELFYAKDETETQQQMSGCISLAYRAIAQKGLSFFKDNRNKLFSFHDIKFGVQSENTYSYTGDEHYRGLFNLVNHNELLGDLDRIKFLIRTVTLLKCLQGSGFFGEDKVEASTDKIKLESYKLDEDEIYIAQLLFHFQTGIQYNLHAVYQVNEHQMEAGKRIPLTDIGAGVYPTTIFFNHSCAPNTVRINMGKKVVYVAKRNIVAGEQVTDCYGIHHLSLNLKERQSLLSRGYLFNCTCEACQKDFPILGNLKMKVSPDVALKLGNTFAKYKTIFGEAKYVKAMNVCQEYLCKLEDLKVPFPHRNYEIAAVALCSCLWAIAAAAQTNDK